jgi:hypothetical protein
MAEEQPSLHIDTDWKKQAQEEKKRLAEREQREREQRAQQQPAAPAGIIAPGLGPTGGTPMTGGAVAPGGVPEAAAAGAAGRAARGGQRELPPASFGTLVQSLLTQTLLYLGELATQAGPMLNLDMAKRQIDLLTILDEKTQNNLSDEERFTLDAALHEARTRFVSVASQFL